jgi:mRNA interferase RelE/StbE
VAARYALEIKRSAQKSIRSLSKRDAERVRDTINALAEDPTPRGASSVAGTPFLRVRVGNYRIVYEVRREELLILVIRVGHRREVYRSL